MKHVILLGDGMADYRIPQLSNKTPLEYAHKPNMDRLASMGQMGLVRTVPHGIAPGSDVANLSVLGYNPKLYYTGRSPLEAASLGISLSPHDVAFRTNLVTLSDEEIYEDKTMIDYSADEISTEEATELIRFVNEKFRTSQISFTPGMYYRHCMVWNYGLTGLGLTPPHDIQGKNIRPYLPDSQNISFLINMMKESYELLKDHPINQERQERGLRPANSIWLWGEGKKPQLPSFYEKWQISGTMISAVDLLRGIAKCARMDVSIVEGATGNLHTNYLGKATAALTALNNNSDFVYIHVEGPDECGHRGEIENKVKAIEMIDEKLLAPLINGLNDFEDYKIIILPDHPTPLSIRTHTSDPVPFVLYQKSANSQSENQSYNEFSASETGFCIEQGNTLMDYLIKGVLHK